MSNGAFRFYTNDTVYPVYNAMPGGIGNGSVMAVDLATGQLKRKYDTLFPTWTSPLVTNGVVFAGHITATGWPYKPSAYGGPEKGTPLTPSGILLALDKDTGELLWQVNVGAQVGIGGPSIGQGMLIVPTGGIQTPNTGGYIVAFGLPETGMPNVTQESEQIRAQLTPSPTSGSGGG